MSTSTYPRDSIIVGCFVPKKPTKGVSALKFSIYSLYTVVVKPLITVSPVLVVTDILVILLLVKVVLQRKPI
jgi:hypothetical protein